VIAKRIDHQPENDNFRALALYVAGIGSAEDKVLTKWTAGCHMDDFYGALKEIEAVQTKNTRSRKNKTYHLMVSWRPEDEAKQGPEIFREIEREFAAALGLAEHQRQAGIHQNTGHIHLHVAYNLIHPRKFTRHAPFRDFAILSQVCRAMEEKYGLTVDNGLEKQLEPAASKLSAKVKTIEAQSGQETLASYVQRRKPELAAALGMAASWAEVHAAFFKYGLTLKPAGNGLVIKDSFGKHSVKASDAERGWSKPKLEKKFGPFEPPSPDMLRTVKPLETYTAAPLSLGSGQEALYHHFQEQKASRKAALEGIEQVNRRRYVDWRARWRDKRLAIKRLPMLKRDRQSLWRELKQREREELAALRSEAAAERKTARTAHPATSWREFLRTQDLMTSAKPAELSPGLDPKTAVVAAPMTEKSQEKPTELGR
jgi:hypothetical protein